MPICVTTVQECDATKLIVVLQLASKMPFKPYLCRHL